MLVEQRALSDISPYENNPRRNDSAVEKVAESIADFGFKVPIVVDKNGVIVAGHTRYLAAEKLGMKEVPVVVADNLSDEGVKAYRLADNRTAEIADWDLLMLDEELSRIENIDMEKYEMRVESYADLFEDAEPKDDDDAETKANTKKTLICPYCGGELKA